MAVRRLGKPAALLIVLQLSSAFVGLGEAMFDHPPTIIAIVVSASVAVAWLVLGWWSGRNRLLSFPRLVLIFWCIVLAIILATMWVVATASDTPASMALEQLLLPLLLFAATPLDGLASLIPLPSQLVRCAIVAAAIFSLSLACYATSRSSSKRPPAHSLSDRVA